MNRRDTRRGRKVEWNHEDSLISKLGLSLDAWLGILEILRFLSKVFEKERVIFLSCFVSRQKIKFSVV